MSILKLFHVLFEIFEVLMLEKFNAVPLLLILSDFSPDKSVIFEIVQFVHQEVIHLH
jgi:hypothetical protein